MTSADPDLATTRISQEAIERRNHWISEIVKIRGAFGDDSSRVEKELADEARRQGANGVVCGHIHTPAIRTIETTMYYNSGDWVESL